MNKYLLYTSILLTSLSAAYAGTVDDKLQQWANQGAQSPSANRGKNMWSKEYPSPKGGKNRSCITCHTADLKASGKHVRTKKGIDPLAPSVNRERLTDAKKIDKWFKRNCKWTIGRECTPQEKSDLITYINSQ